jgi:CDP-diglyceride synthetase
MSTTSDHVIDRSGEPRRRSALADGTLILLSPVLFPIQVFVGIFPVLIVVWAVGAILLWASRAWTAGQKLIGTFLSGASFFSIMVVRVESAEPVGTGAAIAILMMVLLLIATPGIVGVLYLSRRMRPRPAPQMSFSPSPAGDHPG